WSLPYWNYSQGTGSRLLPPAFRDPMLADGEPNPLYVAEREATCNAGEQFADDQDVSIECLGAPDFTDADNTTSFGGPATQFAHLSRPHGQVESAPHDLMHGAVGGKEGWMASTTTAALDPIFWLHHANVDRLWQVW